MTPQSVERHIKQIAEFAALDRARPVSAWHDQSRPVASPVAPPGAQPFAYVAPEPTLPIQEMPPAAVPDESRRVATEEVASSQHVVQLEREVEHLRDTNEFYRDQIKVKDGQIALKDEQISAMLERDRETNFLLQGVQKILTPFLGSPRSAPNDEEGKLRA